MTDPPAIYLPFNRECLGDRFATAKGEVVPSAPRGHWVILQKQALLLPDSPEPCLLHGELPRSLAELTPLWLGTWLGEPCFCVTLAADAPIPAGLRRETLVPLQGPRLSDELLTLGGIALQAAWWRDTSRHCPRCGAITSAIEGEWGRRCTSCRYEHYPHLHPAVITLVRDGTRSLLTRKPGWPANVHGLVAGFVDNGETLEGAVQREVREEVGLEVQNLRYVGSQNWPFPSQLMVGFVADYAGGELRVDHAELESACWFEPDAIPLVPNRHSIARWIIDHHGRRPRP